MALLRGGGAFRRGAQGKEVLFLGTCPWRGFWDPRLFLSLLPGQHKVGRPVLPRAPAGCTVLPQGQVTTGQTHEPRQTFLLTCCLPQVPPQRGKRHSPLATEVRMWHCGPVWRGLAAAALLMHGPCHSLWRLWGGRSPAACFTAPVPSPRWSGHPHTGCHDEDVSRQYQRSPGGKIIPVESH